MCVLHFQRGPGNVHGLLYCPRHARVLVNPALAVLGLGTYRDANVATHCGSRLDTTCPHCGALNFVEELVGQPPHFNICCHNGKTANMNRKSRPDGTEE